MNILVTFTDNFTELRDADSDAHVHRRGWGAPKGWGYVAPWTLARCRLVGAEVWVQRGGQWIEAMAETREEQIDRLERECSEWRESSAEWQRAYDRAWMGRDDARRMVALLSRGSLTEDEQAEMRILVDAAKREGWL